MWCLVLKQKDDGILNRFGINNVVVIKDEGEIVRDSGDIIEQACKN